MHWVMGMNPASPRDGEWLARRCSPMEPAVLGRVVYPPDGNVSRQCVQQCVQTSCKTAPVLSPHQKHPLILATFIPRDEQSLPWRQQHFSTQHPARRAMQIISPLKVTLPWLFLAAGGAGGAGSLPAAAARPVWNCVLRGGQRLGEQAASSIPLLLPSTCSSLAPRKARVRSSG